MNANLGRELQDIPENATVSVYNKRFDGYVLIHPEGYVELTSPAGTVIARFKELEKADWLRESYIRMLVESGIHGRELQEALAAIERVDTRMQQRRDTESRAWLYERSQQSFREWCARQGISHDELTEEQVTQIVNRGIEAVRNRDRATGDE
jgi:hypothetical protein